MLPRESIPCRLTRPADETHGETLARPLQDDALKLKYIRHRLRISEAYDNFRAIVAPVEDREARLAGLRVELGQPARALG